MRLLNRFIRIPIHNGAMVVLINSLNSAILCLNTKETELFYSVLENNIDIHSLPLGLFTALSKHGFIVSDDYSEDDVFDQIVQRYNTSNDIHNMQNIGFIFSYDCNFACPYCYEAERYDDRHHLRMTKSQVDKALSLGQKATHITFFGGEPLLLENRELIKYVVVKKPNATYSLLTNGYNLLDYFDILSKIKIGVLQVTIDGPAQYHNKTRILRDRSGETFSRIMLGVEKYLSAGIPIKIRMTITANQKHLDDSLVFRKELQQQFSKYNDLLTFEISPIFQIATPRQNEMLVNLYKHELAEQNIQNKVVDTELPIVKSILHGTPMKPMLRHCIAESSYRIFFDPFGEMYSCILGVGNTKMSVGRYDPDVIVYKDSVLSRNINTMDKCKKCAYAFFCGGGCSEKIMRHSDNIYAPNCSRLAHIFTQVLPPLLEEKFPIE